MWSNIIKVSWRRLMQNKMYTGLNMIGFVVGLAVSFVILLYVMHETGYDRFHENRERIYRVIHIDDLSGKLDGRTPAALADAIKEEIPEVENVFRMKRTNMLINKDKSSIRERNFWYADAEIFNVLSINVISGEYKLLGQDKQAVMLSESMAQKYFGIENPLQKPLKTRSRSGSSELFVVGVFKDLPKQSSIKMDFIASGLNSFSHIAPPDDWNDCVLSTFVLFKKNVDAAAFETKVYEIGQVHQREARPISLTVQPFGDIYLKSKNIERNSFEKGSLDNIYIFSAVALIILFMAVFNHVILAVARIFVRNKEIGLRKVLGANLLRLILQITGESLLIILIVLPLAFLCTEIFVPVLNNFLGIELSVFKDSNLQYFAITILLAISVGLVPGIIIAFYMTQIHPVQFFNSRLSNISTRTGFWKGFVIMQIFVFMVMTASSIVIYKQLDYTKTKDMGFDQKKIVLIENNPTSEEIAAMGYRAASKAANQRAQLYKNNVLNIPGVKSASILDDLPPVRISSSVNISVHNQLDNQFISGVMFADHDFVETLGLKVLKGRGFRPDDKKYAIIVNETAYKMMMVDNIQDYQFENIVGVVNDFNLHSLRDKIGPLCIYLDNDINYQLIVNVDAASQAYVLQQMQDQWETLFPEQIFRFIFFEDHSGIFYKDEINFNKMVRLFTFIILLITLLGLFGLAYFIAEQRTKEIGVRKILGATLADISSFLVKEFRFVIGGAIVLSVPVVILVMNKWLQNFAYHINIGVMVFVVSLSMSLMFIMLPILYNVIRAARENPVETLRYE